MRREDEGGLEQDSSPGRERRWYQRSAAVMREVVDLDTLRGWRELHDPSLRSEHLLPALATLTGADGDVHSIHGLRVLIGRYSPQHGPVDLTPDHLHDHELYRLGAPHALLELTEDRGWVLTAVSPRALTIVNGQQVRVGAPPAPLVSGDEVTLGVCTWRFDARDAPEIVAGWEAAREDMLRTESHPSLFLCMGGGLYGPRLSLAERRPYVIGRSFDPRVCAHPQPDWDLSGLPERMRRYVAFRHAVLVPVGEDAWEVEPLSARHKLWVNRRHVREATRVNSGDELGMGTVTMLLYHPVEGARERAPSIVVPKLVDWDREHTKPRLEHEEEDR